MLILGGSECSWRQGKCSERFNAVEHSAIIRITAGHPQEICSNVWGLTRLAPSITVSLCVCCDFRLVLPGLCSDVFTQRQTHLSNPVPLPMFVMWRVATLVERNSNATTLIGPFIAKFYLTTLLTTIRSLNFQHNLCLELQQISQWLPSSWLFKTQYLGNGITIDNTSIWSMGAVERVQRV